MNFRRTSIDHLFIRLWSHISLPRRRQFGFLFTLILLASGAEIFSIGMVLPFLTALTNPELLFDRPVIQPIVRLMGLTEAKQLLIPLTFAFGFAAIFAGAVRLCLLWVNTHLSYATGADLSISIYSRTLYQPYSVHCSRNSSEIIDGILNKTNVIIFAVSQILTILSSAVILLAILAALFYIDPVIASLAFGGFGLIYIFIVYMTRKRQLINSQRIARESTHVIKSLQEGLGGIRDVLIDGSQAVYCNTYRKADRLLRHAQGDNAFISASPRYAMEAMGMLLISILAYALSLQSSGMATVIPILAAIAFGAQRLLPVLQQAYSAWVGMRGVYVSLQDALALLDQPLPDYANKPLAPPLIFKKGIGLRQLGFRYSQELPYILKGVNLDINKGSRIGFIGTTGSGKSTLIDVIMGLLTPTDGILEIDGVAITLSNNREWQAHIAHVPQSIFLADSTIEENIAFGIPKDQIDRERMRQAAEHARIASAIEMWPNKYETIVGERGIRLSGGQRQRIGIARALYKRADVIIFDEATSSLDSHTENEVMQAIDSLSPDLTLLIIAHRLTTLKNCTQIVELGDTGIRRICNYHEVIKG